MLDLDRVAPQIEAMARMQALQAGAAGFLSKSVPIETLSRVVRSVARGEAAFSRTITMRLIERLRLLPEGMGGARPHV